MSDRKEYGLLIDYEYCTGCHTCEVACCQEYGWEAGMSGMQVLEVVQKLPKGKAYLCFIPFPTELCVLCPARRKEGMEPACAKHCMANVIRCGPIEELAGEMLKKKRMVLWRPR